MPRTDTNIKIDKNIPFPASPGRGRKSSYPWLQMNVGDSFTFVGSLANAQSAASYYTTTTNKTFRARAYNGAMRIWRVK